MKTIDLSKTIRMTHYKCGCKLQNNVTQKVGLGILNKIVYSKQKDTLRVTSDGNYVKLASSSLSLHDVTDVNIELKSNLER